MSINEQQVELITDFLAKKISPYLIILFGSAVRGNLRINSDIDIAFLSNHKLNDYEVFILSQELADLLHREVDLIDLAKASTVFQAQILNTGRVIHCSDFSRKLRFHALVLKKYAMLNQERACVLKRLEGR
ncbi:type VII toxin-antitoxin system MntA family adenylyltransferase antitoxin [Desulforamulus ferrireducens]|uniref:DNA polymerase subunit beta n=1 Tax=Desulforamulus ferrireducens TaxID=1833852 RepID=A0A1S6IYG6_9FIRM|nr:nucleotidyltransferase domain-containing protein [Desulforamulus ferrireducens]AQS59829.1 DNA polymerase subunit beta [Desulforamulus ferrireducens]